MHAKPGRGIYFDNRPAHFFVGAGDIGSQKIHAAYIQTDALYRPLSHLTIVRMANVCHIDSSAAG